MFANLLTRGELAKRSGVNRETIRFYERSGLVREDARTDSGYTLFKPMTIERVHFIKRAQSAGFSLMEIKALLDIKFDAEGTCGDVRIMAQEKIHEIDRKIRALEAMKASLHDVIMACPGGSIPVSECPILEHFTD